MNREKLVNAGINYQQGVDRFAGNAALYEKYLLKIFSSGQMEKLQEQLLEKDYENAFRSAHDLKGVSGNLSMNAFYKEICRIVEELRGKIPGEEIMEYYEAAERLYKLAEEAVKSE